MPEPNHVRLVLYNSAGEQVRFLYEGDTQFLPAGVSMTTNVLAAGQDTLSFLFTGGMQGLGNGPLSVIPWDGTNDNGQLVAGGQYYAKIEARDGFGNVISLVDSVVVIRATLSQKLSVYNSAGELVAEVPLPSGVAASRLGITETAKVLELDPVTGLPKAGFNIIVGDSNGSPVWTQWNGLNSQGQPVSSGLYTLELVTEVAGGASQRQTVAVQVLGAPTTITLGAPYAAPQPYHAGPLWVFYQALPGNEAIHARLYNAAGELVLQGAGRGQDGRLSLDQAEKLASGIYVLELSWVRGTGVMERKIAKVAVTR